MNDKLKILLLILILALGLGIFASAEAGDNWMPEGIDIDFENVVPEIMISSAGTGDPYVEGGVLCIPHGKDEYIIQKDMSETPIVFKEDKDYVLSFDFRTGKVGGTRQIFNYGGEIGYGKGYCLIHFKTLDGAVYISNGWNDKISKLETGTDYNIEFLIDGASRRLYEVRVNGTPKTIDLAHFWRALPEVIDNFNIVQKNWGDGGTTQIDNIKFREIDKTQTNLFFKSKNGNEISYFGYDNDIEICTAVKLPCSDTINMYVGVYEGNTLLEITPYTYNLSQGMNYLKEDLYISGSDKKVKVFLWNSTGVPLTLSGILKSNANLLEYKSRIKLAFNQRNELPTKEELLSYLDSINGDGSFSNVNYTTKTVDYCYTHCDRLLKIAHVLWSEDDLYSDIDRQTLISALEKGIEYWIGFDTTEFTFDNWYYEYITVPDYMSKTLFLLEDVEDIDEGIVDKLNTYMVQKTKEIDSVSKRDTGSNILQLQQNKIYYALYTEDANMLKNAFERINKELRLASDMTELGDLWRARKWETSTTISGLPDTYTGIQDDYAYLFHGPQLHSGSYGCTFLCGVAEILVDTKNLDLFPLDGVKNITDLLLEHYAYIGRGNTMDYSTIGRMIGEKGDSVGADYYSLVYDACDNLVIFGSDYRRDELLAFSNSRPKDDGVITPAFTGHKYFYSADYTAHAKENYLFTLKASSARTIASECGSYRNLKGRHLGDGVTFIYRTGKEYEDAFAAFNWHRLPGTTAEEKAFDEITTGSYTYESTKSQRVGGINFNGNGATAMELIRDGLTAKKSWFMFDDAVVCLGTDITQDTDNNVYTSVNQCLSFGDALYANSDGKLGTLAFGTVETKLDSPKWILHDGIGYIFNSNQYIYAENLAKKGDRYEISWRGSPVKNKTEMVSRNILSLWFNHKTDNTTNYEYIIVPDTTSDELNSYAEADTFKVLSNSSAIQAASCAGEVQAAFWAEGSLQFGEYSINASDTCLIAATIEDGKISLKAAVLDPEVTGVTITISKGTEKVYTQDFEF